MSDGNDITIHGYPPLTPEHEGQIRYRWEGGEATQVDVIDLLDEVARLRADLLQAERDALAESEKLCEERDRLRAIGDALAEGVEEVVHDPLCRESEKVKGFLRKLAAEWREARQ